MIALLQRVSHSSVTVDNSIIGQIGNGLNILLGVKNGDTVHDVDKLINKIVNLRIFADEQGKMNLSIIDIKGEALVISQFTLTGNTKKGRRPSFDESAPVDTAKQLYTLFADRLSEHVHVETGEFGAHMDVVIHNDGPVTFVIDSHELN